MDADLTRRFGGVARLYGQEGASRLRHAHVCIIGIGGVGSWTVEALARSAVGKLTLIDLDMVAESNTNRQIHALDPHFGQAKVEAMQERIARINPACEVHCVEDFIDEHNIPQLIREFDVVIDAIDQVRAKVALLAHCRQQGIPIVTVGAAGGQIDPTQIRQADLSQTVQDPLLAKVRNSLRRHHQFPRDPKRKFGIAAIYSTEPLRYPAKSCDSQNGEASGAALACAGFGSSVCVTSVFGMAAAAWALQYLAQAPRT